jgi:hypothetical protein
MTRISGERGKRCTDAKERRSCSRRNNPTHRLFEGGCIKSSAAFLFDPKPKATFVRSEGTEVPVCVGVSVADDIRENPGFIAGGEIEPLAGIMDEKPDGAGLCELT